MNVLGIGNQKDSLYYFDGNKGIDLEFKNFKSECDLSKSLWHCSLGHHSDQVLDVLKKEIVLKIKVIMNLVKFVKRLSKLENLFL